MPCTHTNLIDNLRRNTAYKCHCAAKAKKLARQNALARRCCLSDSSVAPVAPVKPFETAAPARPSSFSDPSFDTLPRPDATAVWCYCSRGAAHSEEAHKALERLEWGAVEQALKKGRECEGLRRAFFGAYWVWGEVRLNPGYFGRDGLGTTLSMAWRGRGLFLWENSFRLDNTHLR